MPSIPQIIALKEKYGSKNNITKTQLVALNENFRVAPESLTRTFSYQGLDSNILQFFEKQMSADIVLIFIDITGFSKKCKDLTNSELAFYLDRYYDIVIPIIYAHGGEVEKIMGDGIIAIFGQPFLTAVKDTLFTKADKCAKDLVMLLKGTDKEVKVALHDGNIMYYKNKTLNYPEYTVIGKPLTELYRLESVAENNSISFYHASPYEGKDYSQSKGYCISDRFPPKCGAFTRSAPVRVALPGVDLPFIRHLTCSYMA